MILNPKILFTNYETIKVSILMTIVAIISKWLAAVIFGKIVKLEKAEVGIILGLSINQAAATLAAVLIAYNLKIFNANILTGSIMMILVTCVIGPIITNYSCRTLLKSTKDKLDFKQRKRTNRILIALKNPNTMNNLIDLALYLHPHNSHEPIYPHNIVIEGIDTEAQLMQGENLLTKAVTRIKTANKSVVPLTSIDINLQSALNKAIKENRISKVVLGWRDNSSEFTSQFINNAIDKFIASSFEMIFIANIKKTLNITKRIFLILPPLINKQNGFYDTIIDLKKFALSINAELVILTEKQLFEEIKETFIVNKPTITAHLIEIISWKKIIEILKENIEVNDLIMPMIARPGRLAWRLSFERLPQQLNTQFQTNNIITVYPYYNLEDYDYEADKLLNDLSLLNNIPEENFYFNITDSDPLTTYKQIIQDKFLANNDSLFNQLKSATMQPIEFNKQISLVHIHTLEVSSYTVFILVNKQGFHINTILSTPQILIVLLSPKDQKIENHLKILSEIAQLVQMKNFTDLVLNTDNYNDLIDKLSK